MLIDTHAHIYVDKFVDKSSLIARSRQAGVEAVFMPNIDLDTIDAMHDLADTYPDYCYAMMGLHPCHVGADYLDRLQVMRGHMSARDYVAVGEIGIDLYWDKTFAQEQQDAFERQIEWARELSIPFVIHSRDALDLTIDTVARLQRGDLNGIFHCFNGSKEQAQRIIDMGFYLGLGGVITYKNANMDESLAGLPLSAMVLETDAPYLTPVRFRKKGVNNEPAYLPSIAERLARILEVSVDEVAATTTLNAKKIFGTK